MPLRRPVRTANRGCLLACLVIGVLLGTASAQQQDAPIGPDDGLDLASLRTELRTSTNAARLDHDLPPLAADAGLARAAQAHAEENAARGVLDHGSPDPARDTPLERIGLAGVALVEVGENLALEPRDDVAVLVVEGWLGSPAHRANLLHPGFTHVGFGAAAGPGGVYVAQLFGTRIGERRDASARAERREVASWWLDLRAPVGTAGMVFLDRSPSAEVAFDAPIVSVRVDAPDASARASLGVRIGDGRYTLSDRATLHPDGRWSADEDGPIGPASIEHARYEAKVEQGVTIELAYEDENAPLRLLVDGAHLPGVLPRAGVLRTWLPDASEARDIDVGLLLRNGTIRIVERFTLTGGERPSLVPGTAVREGSAR